MSLMVIRFPLLLKMLIMMMKLQQLNFLIVLLQQVHQLPATTTTSQHSPPKRTTPTPKNQSSFKSIYPRAFMLGYEGTLIEGKFLPT